MRRDWCVAAVLLLIMLAVNFLPFCNAGNNGTGDLKTAVTGSQSVVVILVEFPDQIHNITTSKVRSIMSDLDRFYREESYGLTSIIATVIDRWYHIPTPLSSLDIQKWKSNGDDVNKFDHEAVNAAVDVQFQNYEYVLIVAAGNVWNHAIRLSDVPNVTKLAVVNENSGVSSYAHEIGHLLPSNYQAWDNVGVPDLYSYAAAGNNKPSTGWVGSWDVMSSTYNNSFGFSAWSRIALGWVTPETVELVPGKVETATLQPLEANAGLRVIVVPLTANKSYVIEVRQRTGFEQGLPSEGVIVYLADLNMKSGEGILQVKAVSDQNMEVVRQYASNSLDLNNAPFKALDYLKDDANHFYMVVVNHASQGTFTIAISGSKFEDSDNDGLFDVLEATLHTNPHKPDTDNDGLTDGAEIYKHHTNPLTSDTDGDGVPDGEESLIGTNPLDPDTDHDGWTDNIDPAPTDRAMPDVAIILLLITLMTVVIIAVAYKHRKNQTRKEKRRIIQIRYCINCGIRLPFSSQFCDKCGARQDSIIEYMEKQKRQNVLQKND